MRARDSRAQQRLLRRRALRPPLRRLATPCRCADGDRSRDQEYARSTGAHLSCDPRSQMGRRGRRLRAGWRVFRRQLRRRRRRFRGDPGRPPHIRLPPYSNGYAARSSCAARTDGTAARLKLLRSRRVTRSGRPELWQRVSAYAPHRSARSTTREDDRPGCRTFLVFGFATCSLSRTPRPPVELTTPGLISSMPAL